MAHGMPFVDSRAADPDHPTRAVFEPGRERSYEDIQIGKNWSGR